MSKSTCYDHIDILFVRPLIPPILRAVDAKRNETLGFTQNFTLFS